ncbi:uncharacterized protein [Solanum tuberosum]|uniref:uncharacterized protein n=1 Tax=Solanum tuberosum TaxID=4113 RepID=UPI00073A266D|nr:PREDICTED: uncharacterized protein LOC107060194 [Solanum tuberosum]
MKKYSPFHWDQSCRNAFESIKRYLMNSPVLGAPTLGKPLILYITSQERSLGALLTQENEAKKEQALYYLSRTLIGAELNYTSIEKLCLALLYAIRKLRHYFEAYTIKLISRADPVKFVMTRPVLSRRLARWFILFNQYEIIYTPQKAVKGKTLANFLVDHPLPGKWETSDEFPDEDAFFTEEMPAWTMFFDGSARRDGTGVGVFLIYPERLILPFSFVLGETCSNNAAEYQALIVGLEMTSDMKIPQLDVYGDSQLIINQLSGSYEMLWLTWLQQWHSEKMRQKKVCVCHRWVIPGCLDLQIDESHYISVRVVEEEDWRKPLSKYLEHGRLPDDPRVRADVKRRAPWFIFHDGILFRRYYEGLFLRCLDKEEAQQTMEEAHSGTCGAHQSGPKLHFRIKRMGYYWPTMVMDFLEHAKMCQACQFHANYIHKSPEALYPTVASWTFDAWGLDVVGPLPKSSKGQMYILVAIDSFSRWAEVVPLKEHERIGEALWAYHTTFRSATQETPFSLVYGVEAVLPLEKQIPSLRIAIQEGLTTESNAQLRLAELEALDEKRLDEQQRLECYQARLPRAFNKKVRPRSFQVGDLVLAARRPIILNKRIGDKFTSKWDGSYVVKETYSSGAYKIIDQDGVIVGPINAKFLK